MQKSLGKEVSDVAKVGRQRACVFLFTCICFQTAEMALRLSAVNRWCVTGTPLTRSVEGTFNFF